MARTKFTAVQLSSAELSKLSIVQELAQARSDETRWFFGDGMKPAPPPATDRRDPVGRFRLRYFIVSGFQCFVALLQRFVNSFDCIRAVSAEIMFATL